MRPTWKGQLSIGLLNVPVHLYSAVREHDTRFNQLHRDCGERVNYVKVCRKHDRELEAREIVKGVLVTDPATAAKSYVPIEEADLEQLPLPTAHAIHVEQFIPLAEVPVMRKQKPLYLGYQDGGEKGYTLLFRAMERLEVAAIGKVAMRGNEQLVAIEPHTDSGVLVCWYLLWADEVAMPADMHLQLAAVKDRDLELATTMVKGFMDGDGLEALRDDSETALRELIAARVEGRPVAAPGVATTNVTDLMDVIRANMELAKTRKGAA